MKTWKYLKNLIAIIISTGITAANSVSRGHTLDTQLSEAMY